MKNFNMFLRFYIVAITIAYVFPLIMVGIFDYPFKIATVLGLASGILVSLIELVREKFQQKKQ